MMRTIAATIDIDAPPVDVWAVLTDLNRYPEWNPHIREGAGAVTAGRRLALRMFPPRGGPVTIRPTVLVAEPAADWRLLSGLPGIFGRLIFSGEHRFALTAAGGGTRLVQIRARPSAASSCPSSARPSPVPRLASSSRMRLSRSASRRIVSGTGRLEYPRQVNARRSRAASRCREGPAG